MGFDVYSLDLNAGLSNGEQALHAKDLFESWSVLRSRRIAYAFRQLYTKPGVREQMKPELQWEVERGLAMSDRDMSSAISINQR